MFKGLKLVKCLEILFGVKFIICKFIIYIGEKDVID